MRGTQAFWSLAISIAVVVAGLYIYNHSRLGR